MFKPYTHLGDMPISTFLEKYWQKQPVLIRQACNNCLPSIPVEELAGLSLEEEVESRLIENTGEVMNWRVLHSPLQEKDFAKDRSFPWTLLVQGVDKYSSEAYEFLSGFRFLPAWRLDDLMISYATEGAGVGAHYDRYDVFLVQGEGRRRWELGQQCDVYSATLPHEQLHLLEKFDSHTSYELEKGDLLYIPPLIAHQGIALTDNCITLSVGFRAPALGEIWQDFAAYHSDQLSIDERLQNTSQNSQQPAQIQLEDIENIQRLMQAQLTTTNIAKWFGQYSSSPKTPDLLVESIDEPIDEDELLALVDNGYGLCRVAENYRCLYFNGPHNSLYLFVNGEMISCDANAGKLAILLADELVIKTARLADYLFSTESPKATNTANKSAAIELFLQLYNQGVIYFDDE